MSLGRFDAKRRDGRVAEGGGLLKQNGSFRKSFWLFISPLLNELLFFLAASN